MQCKLKGNFKEFRRILLLCASVFTVLFVGSTWAQPRTFVSGYHAMAQAPQAAQSAVLPEPAQTVGNDKDSSLKADIAAQLASISVSASQGNINQSNNTSLSTGLANLGSGFASSSDFLSAGSGNAWQEIQSKIVLGAAVNTPQVKHEILNFVKNPKHLNSILQNATPYIYYVFQQTQKRNMPAMFSLLPILESEYNPYAYSRTGAAGIWQLMPVHASSSALVIDWWNDSRRDIILSTNAALNYLVGLNRSFGDWALAAAAYDSGDGTVSAAIKFNKRARRGTDFWSLPLPQETRQYVPRLLALATIVKNPERYGVTLPSLPSKPYFVAFKMNSQLNIEEISKLAGVSTQMVQRLNPGMRRLSTNPNGEYTLLIPASNANVFQNNISRVAGRKHMSWQYHEVHRNENIFTIAKNYHTNPALLMKVNNLANNEVQPGQGILVPIKMNKTFKKPVGVYDLMKNEVGILADKGVMNAEPTAANLQIADLESGSLGGLESLGLPDQDPNAAQMPTPEPIQTPAPQAAQDPAQSQLANALQSMQNPAPTQMANVPVVQTASNLPQASNANAITSNDSLKSLVAKIYGSD